MHHCNATKNRHIVYTPTPTTRVTRERQLYIWRFVIGRRLRPHAHTSPPLLYCYYKRLYTSYTVEQTAYPIVLIYETREIITLSRIAQSLFICIHVLSAIATYPQICQGLATTIILGLLVFNYWDYDMNLSLGLFFSKKKMLYTWFSLPGF